MKALDIPKSGKRANIVAYPTPYGQCERQLVIPANRQTPARDHMRGSFGNLARAWGRRLTEASARPGTQRGQRSRAPSAWVNRVH